MIIIKNTEFEKISGGSKGLYYEDGVSYVINCPLVSQPCLDKFLTCTEETLPEKEIYNCMKSVAIEYGVFQLKNAMDCVDSSLS